MKGSSYDWDNEVGSPENGDDDSSSSDSNMDTGSGDDMEDHD